jgi:hypothetical protein
VTRLSGWWFNDLDADQSCAACGAAAIQLVPLQRDVSLILSSCCIVFST